jgi:hypothetical protein
MTSDERIGFAGAVMAIGLLAGAALALRRGRLSIR